MLYLLISIFSTEGDILAPHPLGMRSFYCLKCGLGMVYRISFSAFAQSGPDYYFDIISHVYFIVII